MWKRGGERRRLLRGSWLIVGVHGLPLENARTPWGWGGEDERERERERARKRERAREGKRERERGRVGGCRADVADVREEATRAVHPVQIDVSLLRTHSLVSKAHRLLFHSA